MKRLFFVLFISTNSFAQFGVPVPVTPCSFPVGTVFTATTRTTAIANNGRDGAEMIQLGKWVYLLGGWQSNNDPVPGENNEVYRANISDLTTWVRLDNAPWYKRHTFGCGVIGRTIFIWGIGGSSGILGQSFANDCWGGEADVNGVLTWTKKSTLPYAYRLIFGATVHKNYLYTVGGEMTTQLTAGTGPTDVWRSADGKTWTKMSDGIADFSINLSGSLVSAWGNLYVVSGGFYYLNFLANGDTHGVSTSVKVWKSTDDGVNWTQIANIPVGSFYGKTVAINDKIVMCYGLNGNPPTTITELEYMKSDEVTWIQPTVTPRITGRHAVAATRLVNGCNEYLAVATGTNNEGTQFALNDFYTITITP